MARSVFYVKYNGDAGYANGIVTSFMENEGFKLVDYNGGKCFRLGVGLATAMQFASVVFSPDVITIQGWVCAGLGGATMDEMELEGFVDCIPKKNLKKRILKLCRALTESPIGIR